MAIKKGGPVGPGIIGFILGILATLAYQHFMAKPSVADTLTPQTQEIAPAAGSLRQ